MKSKQKKILKLESRDGRIWKAKTDNKRRRKRVRKKRNKAEQSQI